MPSDDATETPIDEALAAGADEPGADADSEAPADEPDTPPTPAPASPDPWQDRYDNLHRRFGEQGSELGSLRQKLAAMEPEVAEFRRWKEDQARRRELSKAEVEARLDPLLRDPDRWREEAVKPAVEEAKAAKKEAAEAKQLLREFTWRQTVREFTRDTPDALKFEKEINTALARVPADYWSREMLDDAYMAAKSRAGFRAEESARKQNEALTRGAALPKGTGAPIAAKLPDRKPGDFKAAVARAKARSKGG